MECDCFDARGERRAMPEEVRKESGGGMGEALYVFVSFSLSWIGWEVKGLWGSAREI